MSELSLAIAQSAPMYNLAMVFIAVFLFIQLFKTKSKNKKLYMTPWKFMFIAVLIFVFQEFLSVIRAEEFIDVPVYINGFFELAIVVSFIYILLLQKAYVKKYL